MSHPTVTAGVRTTRTMLFSALMLTSLLAFGAHAGDRAAELSKADTARAAQLLSKLNEHESSLVGIWFSDDTSRGAMAGTLTFTLNKRVLLAPEPLGDFKLPAMEGTWIANDKTIHIQIPDKSQTVLAYTFSSDDAVLEVLYTNGASQLFKRQSPSNKPSSKETVLP